MSGEESGRFSPEVSTEWGESFREGLEEFIDNLELFLDEGIPAVPIDPNAFTLENDSTLEDLSPVEKVAAMKIALDYLGVDLHDEDLFVRQYWIDPSDEPKVPGKILIRVFETNRTKKDGIYLHEMNYIDEAARYSVGRNEDMR